MSRYTQEKLNEDQGPDAAASKVIWNAFTPIEERAAQTLALGLATYRDEAAKPLANNAVVVRSFSERCFIGLFSRDA